MRAEEKWHSADGIGGPRSTPLGGDPLESKKRSLQAQTFLIIRIRNHLPKCRSASLPTRLTQSESPNMRTTNWGPGVSRNLIPGPGHIKYGWGLSMWLLRTALGKATNSSADTGGARECVWVGCDKLYSPFCNDKWKVSERRACLFSPLHNEHFSSSFMQFKCVFPDCISQWSSFWANHSL